MKSKGDYNCQSARSLVVFSRTLHWVLNIILSDVIFPILVTVGMKLILSFLLDVKLMYLSIVWTEFDMIVHFVRQVPNFRVEWPKLKNQELQHVILFYSRVMAVFQSPQKSIMSLRFQVLPQFGRMFVSIYLSDTKPRGLCSRSSFRYNRISSL